MGEASHFSMALHTICTWMCKRETQILENHTFQEFDPSRPWMVDLGQT